jgi:hypothetical protein
MYVLKTNLTGKEAKRQVPLKQFASFIDQVKEAKA